VVCLIITLLLLVHKVCQWKKIENRSIFDEDMDNYKVGRFLRQCSFWWRLHCIGVDSSCCSRVQCCGGGVASERWRQCSVRAGAIIPHPLTSSCSSSIAARCLTVYCSTAQCMRAHYTACLPPVFVASRRGVNTCDTNSFPAVVEPRIRTEPFWGLEFTVSSRLAWYGTAIVQPFDYIVVTSVDTARHHNHE